MKKNHRFSYSEILKWWYKYLECAKTKKQLKYIMGYAEELYLRTNLYHSQATIERFMKEVQNKLDKL